MNLKQIENEAEVEVESAWSQEAQRRAMELNDETVELVDGEQVMQKAMALIK